MSIQFETINSMYTSICGINIRMETVKYEIGKSDHVHDSLEVLDCVGNPIGVEVHYYYLDKERVYMDPIHKDLYDRSDLDLLEKLLMFSEIRTQYRLSLNKIRKP